jgi:phospholipid/cholesterol/gamma-HCH transport system substrate-binding protein
LLLNGGGLPQLRTISHELNHALGGRTSDLKSFMHTVSTFTSTLDGQRDNIAATLTQLDRLSRSVVADRKKVGHALTSLPKGFRLIEQERSQLVRTLRAIDGFGQVAHRVVGRTKIDFQRNLDNIKVITKQLAQHGKKLAASADALGYPFNVRAANRTMFGDYMNLVTEIEVSAGHLTRDWLGGTPLDGLFTGFMAGTPTGTAAQATNPLSGNPLAGLLGGSLLGGNRNPSASEDPATQPESGALPGLLDSLLGGR